MRILLINDISCIGKCSLTVELPLVSLGGETVDILPTSILSTHTGGFTGYTFRDLSEDFPEILKHWKSLGIKYDYIVSGYLANISQIELVKQIKKEFLKDSGIYICDPSCGDNGKLYVGFDENFINAMKSLVSEADITVPNLTEAEYLVGSKNLTIDELLKKLKEICPHPIITSYREDNKLGAAYLDGDQVVKCMSNAVAGSYHGAGDVFLGALLALIIHHVKFSDAIKIASDYATMSVEETLKEGTEPRYGLAFEKNIPYLVSEMVKHS